MPASAAPSQINVSNLPTCVQVITDGTFQCPIPFPVIYMGSTYNTINQLRNAVSAQFGCTVQSDAANCEMCFPVGCTAPPQINVTTPAPPPSAVTGFGAMGCCAVNLTWPVRSGPACGGYVDVANGPGSPPRSLRVQMRVSFTGSGGGGCSATFTLRDPAGVARDSLVIPFSLGDVFVFFSDIPLNSPGISDGRWSIQYEGQVSCVSATFCFNVQSSAIV